LLIEIVQRNHLLPFRRPSVTKGRAEQKRTGNWYLGHLSRTRKGKRPLAG